MGSREMVEVNMVKRNGWVLLALGAMLVLATGCPSGDDGDSAAGDDDTTGDDEGTPPTISDLSIYVDVPEGESQEMLIFAFDFHDDEGDIAGGAIWLYAGDMSPLDIGDRAAMASLDDEEDATDGSLMVYDVIGDTGFPPGETFLFGVMLLDRAGNESNLLEADEVYTIPGE